jgi:hypothetical protein
MCIARRAAHGHRDVAAALACPDTPLQLGHEVIVERNVQSHGHNIAH